TIAIEIGGNTAGRSETVTSSAMLTTIGGNARSPSDTRPASVTATETGGTTFAWSPMTIRSSTITTTLLGVTVIAGGVEVTGIPPIVAPIVVGVPAAMPVNVAV